MMLKKELLALSLSIILLGQNTFASSPNLYISDSVNKDQTTEICIPCSISQYNSASPWAIDTLKKANELNLIPSQLRGNYKSLITREEFSSLLVSLYECYYQKEAPVILENPFIDSFSIDTLKAYHLGYINGTSKDQFSPNLFITREEIAVMAHRFLMIEKPNILKNTNSSLTTAFLDKNVFSDWAINPISTINQLGLMSGYSKNHFGPKNNTTIEEAVIIIVRLFEIINPIN